MGETIERMIKKKKEALFRRDVEEIKRLAKSKSKMLSDDTSSPHPSTGSV
jgi:hypothetical protein